METQQTQPDTVERNTIVKFHTFFFTWNSPPEDGKELLIQHLDKYHFQLEKGDTADTLHYQGVGRFKNARTLKQIQNLFNGIHIEKPKNWNACLEYCKKQKTKIGPLFSNIDIHFDDPLTGVELHDWQKSIIELIASTPDKRSIYWFYDQEGGSGKTTLAKHLCINNKDILYLSGKASDCKYAVYSFLKKKKLKAVIFDFVRTNESYISYEAIEAIKNGIFFNTKYESEMCIFDNPHIIVFANFVPLENALSKDRLKITNIREKKLTN